MWLLRLSSGRMLRKPREALCPLTGLQVTPKPTGRAQFMTIFMAALRTAGVPRGIEPGRLAIFRRIPRSVPYGRDFQPFFTGGLQHASWTCTDRAGPDCGRR